jgi:hypothetical protein
VASGALPTLDLVSDAVMLGRIAARRVELGVLEERLVNQLCRGAVRA